MTISAEVLVTRAGVLQFPNEAAAFLATNPPNLTPAHLSNEVLATRAGVLRFPNEVADYMSNGLQVVTTSGFPTSPALPANLRFMRFHHTSAITSDMQATDQPNYSGALTRTAQAVHPSVVAFNREWHGYKYWMCITPYPNSSEGLENPSILATNDPSLSTWTEPTGIQNPIMPRPIGVLPQGDPYLMYNPATNKLVVVYIRTITSGSVRQTLLTESSDGVTWSSPVIIFTGTEVSSPCIVHYKDGSTDKYRLVYGKVEGPTHTMHYREVSDDVMSTAAWAASVEQNIVLDKPTNFEPWDFQCYRLASGVWLFSQTMEHTSQVLYANFIGYSTDDLDNIVYYDRPSWSPRIGGVPNGLSYTTALVNTGTVQKAITSGRHNTTWSYHSCPLLQHPWLAMSSFPRDRDSGTGDISSHGQKSFNYVESGTGSLSTDVTNGLIVPAGKQLASTVQGLANRDYTVVVVFNVPTACSTVPNNTYVEICNVGGIRTGLKRHSNGTEWLLEFRRSDTNAPVYQPVFLSGQPWMKVAFCRSSATLRMACQPHYPSPNGGITNLANTQTNDIVIGNTANTVGFSLRQIEVLPDAQSETATTNPGMNVFVLDDPWPQSDIVAAIPTIAIQPIDATPLDANTTISCYAYGYPGPSYQWQEKSPGGDWTNISGATSEVYTRNTLALLDWSFRCVVSNSAGQVISSHTIVI